MVIGQNGKVGRDGFWADENWAKMKLGETAKVQDRYWVEWEKGEVGKGEVGKGEKRMGEMGKIWAKWEWTKWDWANWE